MWDALEGLAAPFAVADVDGAAGVEVIPHPGGTGGVILIDGGKGAVSATIRHAGARANNHSRRIRDLISVETTWIGGEPVTRLAVLVPYEIPFTVRPARRGMIDMDWINGRDFGSSQALAGRPVRVTLDGRLSASMARLRGVSADQLVFDERELDDIQARLAADAARAAAPARASGYLTCMPEDRYPAWIVKAASRGADEDIARVNTVVRERFGGAIRAAYHMASDLPFGSKGRVRSAAYDRQERTGDEELFPIFYDYGQSYGPGITGWNQFLRINLGVRGLARGRRYTLVLHLFDPECRDTRLRITGTATDAAAEMPAGPDIMLRDPFAVAQGIPARYTPAAFVPVPLHKDCRRDAAVNIGIHSHSEYRLYDRLTEGFGFVYLAHAWLVERRP